MEQIHEISNIIYKYSEPQVRVTNIRIGLVCTVCGNEWGIRVEDEKELARQSTKFMCLNCYNKKIQSKVHTEVNYGREQEIPQK